MSRVSVCSPLKIPSWKYEEQRTGKRYRWNIFMSHSCICLCPAATTQDNLDDKLRKFEIRDMMGLTDDRDISETVSETWSTDVLGSDFDPNMDEDRLQEIAGGTWLWSFTDWCKWSEWSLQSLWDELASHRDSLWLLWMGFREMSSPCGLKKKQHQKAGLCPTQVSHKYATRNKFLVSCVSILVS